MKTKIAIIGTAGLPPKYGGFETLAANLVKVTGDKVDYVVYCARDGKTPQSSTYHSAKLIYLRFKANGIQSILYDLTSIWHAWFTADVLLILGTSGCVVLPFRYFFKRKKVVVNFGGLEWKREKWGPVARWFLGVSEGLGVRHANEVIADNQSFVNYIAEKYKKSAHLIEYGGNHVIMPKIAPELVAKYPFLEEEYYVSVSRAQEDNNLHLLLEAFSKMPDRQLVLVSNWGISDYSIKLKQEYKQYSNLHMIGPIYNQTELDTIRGHAKWYIHSHKYCGTAPSLVEAMYLGLPVIAFANETNRYSTEFKALYFETVEDLQRIIQQLSEAERTTMAASMKEIAQRRYTWEYIAHKYLEVCQ
ncbi:MAG TPA: DUF1972 domain-containing protein [Phnomibacter sp.]|nr:DUF1972 domain-containing protein [Phnomibacter sp.]